MPLTPKIDLQTSFGVFRCALYTHRTRSCLIAYKASQESYPLVRLQSSCLFSESLRSRDCDCSSQLIAFLKLMKQKGGFLFYSFEEGRGAGLQKKIEAISIEQTFQVDTKQAYKQLGIPTDLRDYRVAIMAMKAIGVPQTISLATNCRRKIKAVRAAGYRVKKRIILRHPVNRRMKSYLNNKKKLLKHYAED